MEARRVPVPVLSEFRGEQKTLRTVGRVESSENCRMHCEEGSREYKAVCRRR